MNTLDSPDSIHISMGGVLCDTECASVKDSGSDRDSCNHNDFTFGVIACSNSSDVGCIESVLEGFASQGLVAVKRLALDVLRAGLGAFAKERE